MQLQSQFYTRKQFNTSKEAEALITTLLQSSVFAPDAYGPYEPLKKFTQKHMDHAVGLLANEMEQRLSPHAHFTSLLFARQRSDPRSSYYLEWSDTPYKTFNRNFFMTDSIITSNPSVFEEWQSFFLELCGTFESWYATCSLKDESNTKHLMNWYTTTASGAKLESYRGVGYDLYEGIPGIYWGNYFGPFLVDWFGKETIMQLPCHSMRWLDTGGVFFTTCEHPDQWDTPHTLSIEQSIKTILGRDYFFDINLVKQTLAEIHTLPEAVKPEELQFNRRKPNYPFEAKSRSKEVDFKAMERHFEALGYRPILREEGVSLVLQNDKGDKVKITNLPSPAIEFHPKL